MFIARHVLETMERDNLKVDYENATYTDATDVGIPREEAFSALFSMANAHLASGKGRMTYMINEADVGVEPPEDAVDVTEVVAEMDGDLLVFRIRFRGDSFTHVSLPASGGRHPTMVYHGESFDGHYQIALQPE